MCANPDLITLDKQLVGVFEKALAAVSLTERKRLEYDQSFWDASSGACWDRVDCIRKRYADRIVALQSVWRPRVQEARAQAAGAVLREEIRPEVAVPLAAAPHPTTPPIDKETASATSPEVPSTGPSPPTTPADSTQELKTATSGTQQSQEQETAAQWNRQQEYHASLVAETNRQQNAPSTRGSSDWNWLATFGLVVIVVVPLIYCLPTIIAFHKRHRSRWMILALNLAFGATVIGWVIALVWAMNKVDDPLKGGIKYDPQPHDPIL